MFLFNMDQFYVINLAVTAMAKEELMQGYFSVSKKKKMENTQHFLRKLFFKKSFEGMHCSKNNSKETRKIIGFSE